MSTTITYKDNLLTTVDNSIKILRTAGKYLEGDIALADITAKSQANENDPIRFFDYDGTLVASYTEVPESLPEAPTHEGLIAQGWNWTLEDIATQFASSGACDVGQMYTTSDGKTRIYVTVSDMTKSFWLGLAPNGTLSIDWGDGSENSNMTGNSLTIIKTVYHEYATAGSYIISVKAENGEFAFYNYNANWTNLLSKDKSNSTYSNYSYGGCVTAIELGESVKIGNYAFHNLFNMTYITIPNSITNIGSNTFQSCYALKSITIPNGVTNIGNYIFHSCFVLKFITIPNTVMRIGEYAFSYCYALKSIAIPDTVTSIDGYTFVSCYALKSVTIPDGITGISGYMFQDCYALKSVIIPDSITRIGMYAFQGCRTLKSVAIPDTVTSIYMNAFSGCFSLKSITIPDDITMIENYVFSYCRALESVIIPDGVTYIGSDAFKGCFTLKSITVPDSVTNINNNAFDNCYNVDEYHFLSTTPPTLANTNVFYSFQSDCKIYVPYSEDHSILEAYKTATNWSTYANYIVEEGE